MTPDTLVVVPRWSGDRDDDWYPWLTTEQSPHRAVRVVDLAPHPDRPQVDATVAAVADVATDVVPERTLLVGHSVGCQALLRYLATRTGDGVFAGLLCVAGWWTVDEPWDDIRPWLDEVWTAHPEWLDAVRQRVGDVTVLLSDNDPFTSDWATNRSLWRQRLDATVEVVAGAHHFNGAVEPDVAAALARHHDVS